MIAVILPLSALQVRGSGAGHGAPASDRAWRGAGDPAIEEIARLAEDFSPRIECGASGVALDASGLSRLFGSAEGLATELVRQAAARGLQVRVAVAATRTAAALIAAELISRPGVVPVGSRPKPGARSSEPYAVIPPGHEAAALAPLPLARLAGIADLLGPALDCLTAGAPAPRLAPSLAGAQSPAPLGRKAAAGAPKRRKKGQGRNYRLAPAPDQQINKTADQEIDRLARWGLKTLGDLASLPSSELSARLGPVGLVLQRAATGQDERPLVPSAPDVSFMQSMRLEWPVDDLQPLAFIVARLCEGLEQALAAADRGAITLTTMLRLVTKEAYARTLALPSPMRDARVLRTLVMLDLESHPPGAAIDEVVIDVDVAPGRILQTGLFAPALPEPEALSTLVARLSAVAGESRVGAPALVDTHAPGAFEMRSFAPHQAPDPRLQTPAGSREISRPAVVRDGSALEPGARSLEPSVIRRFRPPRAARVRVGPRGPVRVDAEDISGDVLMAAGPWRSSGGWWSDGWDRDEWDVSLDTGLTCRLARERATGKWVVDGVLD